MGHGREVSGRILCFCYPHPLAFPGEVHFCPLDPWGANLPFGKIKFADSPTPKRTSQLHGSVLHTVFLKPKVQTGAHLVSLSAFKFSRFPSVLSNIVVADFFPPRFKKY